MDRDKVAEAVRTAVRDICKLNGHDVKVDEATVPFDLPDFDSITSLEVVVEINRILGTELQNNPFIPETNRATDSIGSVVDSICERKADT